MQKPEARKNTTLIVVRRKYQFMEVNTQRRRGGLDEKIPDIQKTLETVQFLKTRKVRHSTNMKFLLVKSLKLSISSLTQTQSRPLSSSTIHSTLKRLFHLRMKSTCGWART